MRLPQYGMFDDSQSYVAILSQPATRHVYLRSPDLSMSPHSTHLGFRASEVGRGTCAIIGGSVRMNIRNGTSVSQADPREEGNIRSTTPAVGSVSD